MAVALSSHLEIAFIAPTGGDRTLMKMERCKKFSCMMRMMNTHLPWGTIRSWANDSKIPTEVDHPASNPQIKERMDSAIRCELLGYSAKVEFHIGDPEAKKGSVPNDFTPTPPL